jgi:hypothetical protein
MEILAVLERVLIMRGIRLELPAGRTGRTF